MNIKYMAFGAFLGLVMASTLSLANDYIVKNVKVDVQSENVIQAREEGLGQARRSAFNVLMRRMVNANDQKSIPQSDDKMIASMVDSFSINREKTSKDRYLASVNVVFNERAVNGYLGRYTNQAVVDNTLTAQPDKVGYSPDQGIFGTTMTSPIMQQPSYANLSRYKIQVNVGNLAEWVRVKNEIQSIPSITATEIDVINAGYVIISVMSPNTIQSLQNDLNLRGLRLFQSGKNGPNDAPYILLGRG